MGFWGKIPARGDFVRWGLPREFLEPWDEWLGGVVVGARELLGGAWEAAWDAAAPCRFLLAPGLCGPWQVAGVWVPSWDRVGREYPLTFAMEVRGNAAFEAPPFFGHVEAAGTAALHDGLDPAALTARMLEPCRSQGPINESPPGPAQGSVWRPDGAWAAYAGLPDTEGFASLLDGRSAI